MPRYIFILLFSLTALPASWGQVIINEIVASNADGLEDVFGNNSDWIELFNTTNEDINLQSYSITNKPSKLYKWSFPAIVLPAKEHLIVFCSGRDIDNPAELHTNFKLSQSGEALILTNSSGQIISEVSFEYFPTNHSLAAVGNSPYEYYYCNDPTPGYSNGQSNGIFYSHTSGYYNAPFDLKFFSPVSGNEIRITKNAANPDSESELYSAPLHLTDVSNDPFVFSGIPTTPMEGAHHFEPWYWKEPQSVYKANVIRAEVFSENTALGNPLSLIYFIDPGMMKRYTFPVVSIITDSLNLFSQDTGIYVPGVLYGQIPFDYWPAGNFTMRGKEWERSMYLNYFEPGGKPVLETQAGMRIRGFGSAGFSQKSLNIYFRKEYGTNKLKHDLFPNSSVSKFKRLIFRNGGNDFPFAHLRDVYLSQVIRSFHVETQEYQPIIVFMNGEYWGIHNMREKIDKHHLGYKYDYPSDDIIMVGVCGMEEEGDNTEYFELVDYIENHDLSTDEAYAYVSQKLDIQSTIDYNIAEIYFANYDWPCNNYRMWKSTAAGSKWKYIIYDLDYSFGYDSLSHFEVNSLRHAVKITASWPNCECASIIFRNLLKNKEFTHRFISTFKKHLEEAFSVDNMNRLLDKMVAQYNPEMQEHILRYGFPESIDEWYSNLDVFREFINNRSCVVRDHIIEFFELDDFGYDCVLPADTQLAGTKGEWILYPNPNNGRFNIYNKLKSDDDLTAVVVYDLLGREIFEDNQIPKSTNMQYTLHLNDIQSGVYILKLQTHSTESIFKIVVNRRF